MMEKAGLKNDSHLSLLSADRQLWGKRQDVMPQSHGGGTVITTEWFGIKEALKIM